MKEVKTILIATGIYPPQIGGPSEYAKNLEEVWKNDKKKVLIATFGLERSLPTGIRHIYFFVRNFIKIWKADFILVLDTWSVALPTSIACLILNKKFTIRTGGDFLWESYVERTKKKILLRNFYNTEMMNFNLKERIVFWTTKWILKRAEKIIFSTIWQRNIWEKSYNLDLNKTKIVENFYGKKIDYQNNQDKVFLGSVRDLVWKNTDLLKLVFEKREMVNTGFTLDLNNYPNEVFLEKMKSSYAVILVSLGDISPNMIMDAIKLNKPFIVTKEIGIYDRIKDIAIFVDPLDENDILSKVLWLIEPQNYLSQKKKIENFNFTHTWEEITKEILL